ncbi:C2H2 type zinc-finger-domain-containing protein [Podospora didyma]|uniref:C2H2 type zinc-finger-domain-containing protein n=1 Tax=Podospora didyma TaxID=330526 RepID=A0AAE0U9C3_9PEZI|nr:C2H2 type zinc-finger-domain-containing protein [Podospora didyma]
MEAQSVFKLSSKFCSACNVSFKDDNVRRVHAKSQWHVENLRRRVAGLPPVDSSEAASMTGTREENDGLDHSTDPESSSDKAASSDEASSSSSWKSASFVPGRCLFCPKSSPTIQENVSHMQEGHGLFIPDTEHLIVNLETLVQYLHLVIFEYRECLYCHSKRRTVQAVQQHMSGKGHCKFDLDHPDSEYRDFYDFTITAEEEDSSTAEESKPPQKPTKMGVLSAAQVGGGDSARLLSGKTVSNRSAAQTGQGRQHRPLNNPSAQNSIPIEMVPETPVPAATDNTDTREEKAGPSSSSSLSLQAITKQEKRVWALASQLASLSATDRASLSHLQVSEQRNVLATQKKQAEKARRAQRRYTSRMEIMGNRTLFDKNPTGGPGLPSFF